MAEPAPVETPPVPDLTGLTEPTGSSRTLRHGDALLLGAEVDREGRRQFGLTPRGLGGRKRARRFPADQIGWSRAWADFAAEDPVHARAYADAQRPRPVREEVEPVPLLTLPTYPGREVVEVLGDVLAHPVVSRNAFSDLGSDLMSSFGGPLVGIEKGIARAVDEARRQLHVQAAQLGADAVLGLSVGVHTVSESAQAVVMSGTAVRLRPATTDGAADQQR